MSYRECLTYPEVCTVPPLLEFHFLNGTTPELLITCDYEIDGVDVPIHLTTEGYSDPVVAFEPVVEGLSAIAEIDVDDDHIIHCFFTVKCPDAISIDVKCDLSILTSRSADPTEKTDCVLRGKLTIENSPLPVVV